MSDFDKEGGGGILESIAGTAVGEGTFGTTGAIEGATLSVLGATLEAGVALGVGAGSSMVATSLSISASDILASFEGADNFSGFLRGSRRSFVGSFGAGLLGAGADPDEEEEPPAPNKMLEMALGNP